MIRRLNASSLQVAPNVASGYESDAEEDDFASQNQAKSDSEPRKSSSSLIHDREGYLSSSSQSVIRQLQPTPLNSIQRNSLAQLYGPNYARMDSLARHQKLTSDYHRYYGHSRVADPKPTLPTPKSTRSDADVLRENYRFVRTETDDADLTTNWEQRMAKRYYDRLFREYAIVDLSRYKEGKVGLRWRTDSEVFEGRGQFTCANKHCSSPDTTPLQSFELNFVYLEAGVTKQSLVKVRVCADCAYKLHYNKIKQMKAQEKQQRKLIKKERKEAKKHKKKFKSSKKKSESERSKRKRSSSISSSSSSTDSSSTSGSRDSDNDNDVEIIASASSSSKASRVKYASDAPSSSSSKQRSHDGEFSEPQSKQTTSSTQSRLFAAASGPNASGSNPKDLPSTSSSAAAAAVISASSQHQRQQQQQPPASPTTEQHQVENFFQQYFPSMFP